MKKILLPFTTTLTTLLITFFNITPAFASTNNFYFEKATFDYYLSKDSSGMSKMKVVETYDTVFPDAKQNHGLTRVIPYSNQSYSNLTMQDPDHLHLQVTRNGQPEKIAKIENDTSYNAFTVYIGDKDKYVTGRQTYVLEYEFENVITNFTNYQELYWDTNGTGWSQKFNTLTANLHFASDLPVPNSATDAWCYVGVQGSNNQNRCQINNITDGLSFTTTDLSPRENLTFVTKFPENTFTDTPRPINHNYTTIIIFYALLVLTSIAVILTSILRYLRESAPNLKYYKNLATPAQYVPLRGLSVAELAKIYLKSTKNPLVATILELATSHKIELLQTAKKRYAIRISNLDDLSDLQLLALQFFAGKSTPDFTVGETIEIPRRTTYSSVRSSLANSFNAKTEQNLVTKKLLKNNSFKTSTPKDDSTTNHPSKTLKIINVLFVIAFFLIVIIGFVVNKDALPTLGSHPILTIIPLAAIGVTILSIGLILGRNAIYSRYTTAGLDASNYAAGLKDYISLAEKDRLAVLQSVQGADVTPAGLVKLYEKLLPYAAIFGLEKSWLKQLQIYYDEDPSLIPAWYISTSAFDAHDFSNFVSDFSSSMSSMTSSSTSSGSGGSGSSGGGGGGGGGGGW